MTGPQLKVSSDRLREPGVELKTRGCKANDHLSKPRVLSPLRSLRKERSALRSLRKERSGLVPLACENGRVTYPIHHG